MTGQEYEYTTIRQDIRNLFTKKGMKNTWLFITDMEAYDKQDPHLCKNYCTECGHHEKHHQDKYHSDQGFCKKCWNEQNKLHPTDHKFNEKQSEIDRAISQVLPNTRIQRDDYRIYIYTTSISKEQLDNLESFFGYKITQIKHLNPKNHYADSKYFIIAWTTKIFCRYCNNPFKTEQEKRHHEQKTDGWACYQRPPEVTFATGL